MSFLLKYWRGVVAVAVVLLLLGLAAGYRSQARRLEEKLVFAEAELSVKNAQLENLADERDTQMDRLQAAERRVAELSAQQKEKVRVIREQVIPKECQGAIDFAIDKKGDLAW